MKLSPHWLRDFVDLTVDNRRLAEDLTSVGIAVEGIYRRGRKYGLRNGDRHQPPRRDEPLRRGPRSGGDLRPAAEAIWPKPSRQTRRRQPSRPSGGTNTAPSSPIEIAEPDLCPRFSARVLRNVTIKPSPAKVAQRLALLDQRPISNAVDATNYVLWEMGKPTHVFDLDLLEGGKIIVRRARDGEKAQNSRRRGAQAHE